MKTVKTKKIQKCNKNDFKLYKNAATPTSNNYNHIKSNHTSIKLKIKLFSKQKAVAVVFRLDALAKALSVIATATWLAGWLAGWLGVCHSRYCIKTTKPIRKLFGPSGRPII